MLSINTNLSSIIAQNSMKQSTNKLNQAIERMTTGAKINHSKDNAANYSISTNMTTKIGSYNVAEDNCAMGLDLLATAEGSLNLIQEKLTRLRSLAVTAQNGTYDVQSLDALETEAESIVSEIKREYANVEYNGIKLFNQRSGGSFATSREEILSISTGQRNVDNLDSISLVDEAVGFVKSEYKIDNSNDLIELVRLTNDVGLDTTNITFVLTQNIDIGAYCDQEIANGNGGWTPIGNSTNDFKGTFDGNGFTIQNLKIDRSSSNASYQGLFGKTSSSSNIIKLGVENVDITGYRFIGGLVGSNAGNLTNCYVTGKVTLSGTYSGGDSVGGLVGAASGEITNCYSSASVWGSRSKYAGGLVGQLYSSGEISCCYASGEVGGSNQFDYVGGLVGYSGGNIANCYTIGNVEGRYGHLGGFVACTYGGNITNCYSAARVYSMNASSSGIFAGEIADTSVSNSYAAGTKVSYQTDGFVSYSYDSTFTNCYSTDTFAGSLSSSAILSNCASVKKDTYTTQMTNEEIKTAYAPEIIGYTGVNGWTIVDSYDNPLLSWQKEAQSSTAGGDGGITDDSNESLTHLANDVNLQVGISSRKTSTISFKVDFDLSAIDTILINGLSNSGCIAKIDNILNSVSNKITEYGAMQNRLISALNEITVQRENLISSRSTLRDTDIADISSEYIRQQILQQASATLLATANQSASIALSLI